MSSDSTHKLVFTNGCFDIIHRGHITYLNEAKKRGGRLLVGLNSDASIRRIKGPQRPINGQDDRKFVLQNLRSVDEVIIFDQDTPYELIKKVQPDVLVKGGDWRIADIVGADIVLGRGGVVESLSLVEGCSTTELIARMQCL